MTEEIVVSIKNVFFAYNITPVLEDVNLSLYKGEHICVIGPNAGGKTTLLKLILGLISPIKGKVSLLGKKPDQARMCVGYMPQYTSFDPQFPITVLDVTLMGRLGKQWFGPYSKEDKKAAAIALEKVGLESALNKYLSTLSGGQRQRVLIARALACNPAILILDEPTANVDMEGSRKLSKILQELNKYMTILIVTHDVGFVSNDIDRVICVNKKVFEHPMSKMTDNAINELYASEVQFVHHDKVITVKE